MFTKIIDKNKFFNNSIPSDNISSSPIPHDDRTKIQFFEDLNFNILNNIYLKEDSSFKKTIDKLNVKFYSETNKYLGIKSEIEKSQDNLFLILFKQISFYIEEIEKLNIRLREKDEKEKVFKNKIDEVNLKLILINFINFFTDI